MNAPSPKNASLPAPSPSSQCLVWCWGVLFFAALTVMLAAPDVTQTLPVPLAECKADAAVPEVLTWPLPESAHAALTLRPWRNDSSFLFAGARWIPLHTAAGWPKFSPETSASDMGFHKIDGQRLVFRLPKSLQWTPPETVELTLQGDVSRLQAGAWLVAMFGLAGWSLSRKALSVPHPLISGFPVAGMILCAGVAGLTTPTRGLPFSWQFHGWGQALARAESFGPGLLVLLAIFGGWNRWRKCRTEPAVEGDSGEVEWQAWFVQSGWLLCVVVLLVSWIRICSWGISLKNDWVHGASYGPWCSGVSHSDASDYLSGASQLRWNQPLDQFNQRRPVNASYYQSLLLLTGDQLWLARAVQGLLLAFVTGFLVREIVWHYGLWVGLANAGMLWGISRAFLTLTSSETLGYLLGCLATVCLLRGLFHEDFRNWLLGLALLALALSSRPGAMFLLPLLGLFLFRWRTAIASVLQGSLAMGVIAASLAINSLILLGVGAEENSTGSNFAYTFAGLATGRSWSEVQADYQEELSQFQTEKEIAAFLYREAWQKIQTQPQVLVRELLRAQVMFAALFPEFLHQALFHEGLSASRWERFPPLFLWLVVIGLSLKRLLFQTSRIEFWFWLVVMAGIFSSVSIVFLDGSYRSLTATWPLFFVFFFSGCHSARSVRRPDHLVTLRIRRLAVDRSIRPLEWITVGFYLVMILLPLGTGRALEVDSLAAETVPPLADVKAAETGQPIEEVSLPAYFRNPALPVWPDSQTENGAESPAGLRFQEWQQLMQVAGVEFSGVLWDQLPEAPFYVQQCYLPEWRRVCVLISAGATPLPSEAKLRVLRSADQPWIGIVQEILPVGEVTIPSE